MTCDVATGETRVKFLKKQKPSKNPLSCVNVCLRSLCAESRLLCVLCIRRLSVVFEIAVAPVVNDN